MSKVLARQLTCASIAALALASGLVLTACSSSDDDTAAEPAASEARALLRRLPS